MYCIVIEQTKDYTKRIAYDPVTNTFHETGNDCLFHQRGFIYPYGWLQGFGTPPQKHLDAFLLSRENYALGEIKEIKIVGVFKRNDGDHKLVGTLPERSERDFSQLPNEEKNALYKLYPHVSDGEGWFGAEMANEIIVNFNGLGNKNNGLD